MEEIKKISKLSDDRILVKVIMPVFADTKGDPDNMQQIDWVTMKFRFKKPRSLSWRLQGINKTKGGPFRYLSTKYATKMSQISYWTHPQWVDDIIPEIITKLNIPSRIVLNWDDKKRRLYREEKIKNLIG